MTQTSNPAKAVNRASIEELAARGGIAVEHVVLDGGSGDQLEVERSTAVRQRIELRNPVQRARVELRIFKDNFMSVIEHRGRRRMPERVIDLRYLDPSPQLSRYIAKKTGRVAVICAASTALWLALALLGLWPAITGTIAAVSVAATCAMAVRYVLRTRDTITFQTRHGRAVVLALVANVGSMHSYRHAVPGIVAAIRHANAKLDGDRAARLCAEVREHYRLARAGVIARADCEQATRLVLSGF